MEISCSNAGTTEVRKQDAIIPVYHWNQDCYDSIDVRGIVAMYSVIYEGGWIMNNTKRRIHDGIVGVVITLGVALGYTLHPAWLVVPGVIGFTLIQSAFTGFCPVYFLLDKTCAPEAEAGLRRA